MWLDIKRAVCVNPKGPVLYDIRRIETTSAAAIKQKEFQQIVGSSKFILTRDYANTGVMTRTFRGGEFWWGEAVRAVGCSGVAASIRHSSYMFRLQSHLQFPSNPTSNG